jgi:iron-sulfur cluster assembly protein
MALVVTEQAAKQILASAQDSGQQGTDLRIAAKRSADGAIEYAMGFDERHAEDVQVNWYGVNVVVAPTSTELLSGATLDYVELEAGRHEFIFMNPNDPHYVPPDLED